MDLEIEKKKKGDVVILNLRGDLTIGSNEQLLKDAVAEAIAKKNRNLLVNLQNVDMVDSCGIGALVKSYTSMTQAGGRLKLLQPSKFVRQTLAMTGLLGIFDVFEEETSAISSF